MFGFPADGGVPLHYDGIMVCVDMFSKRGKLPTPVIGGKEVCTALWGIFRLSASATALYNESGGKDQWN